MARTRSEHRPGSVSRPFVGENGENEKKKGGDNPRPVDLEGVLEDLRFRGLKPEGFVALAWTPRVGALRRIQDAALNGC